MSLIELKDIQKIYKTGKLMVPALLDINVEIKEKEMVAIMGPSGSGKSTLMNIIGLLDRPTGGEISIGDSPLTLSMSDRKLAELRGKKIGFVFQSFNLLPRLSALENVLVPTAYQKGSRREFRKRALALLEQVNLTERVRHRPTELSGGEKQRVAIARALINNPDIILADEPTGNLDSKSGQEIITILRDLNQKGKTVIVITHDQAVARSCHRIIRILDGQIQEPKHVV
jgi:putative ABC transport system ATP-binding protein